MNIWRDHYGLNKSADFVEGVKAGIKMYAWWKDGRQQVGTTGRTLEEALLEVDQWLAEIECKAKETLGNS